MRYGIPAAIALAPLLLAFAHAQINLEIFQLLEFIVIITAGIIAGFGPALFVTLMVYAGNYFLRPQYLSSGDWHLLGIEGVLISLVGGTLRASRQKTSDQLAANLRLEQQILEIGDDERAAHRPRSA